MSTDQVLLSREAEAIRARRQRQYKVPKQGRSGVRFDVGDRVRLKCTRQRGTVERVCGLGNSTRLVSWDRDVSEAAGVREYLPVHELGAAT